jgi:imidazolonepropionase-like amidohydrolase
MPLLKNIGFLATCKEEGSQNEIHPIRNAVIRWKDGEICWVGREDDLPE